MTDLPPPLTTSDAGAAIKTIPQPFAEMHDTTVAVSHIREARAMTRPGGALSVRCVRSSGIPRFGRSRCPQNVPGKSIRRQPQPPPQMTPRSASGALDRMQAAAKNGRVQLVASARSSGFAPQSRLGGPPT